MACVGRTMSRSFLSTTRSALRACKATGSEAVGKGSMKGRNPCSPSPAAPSPSSFSQTRRPASYFYRLPGEVACVQSLLPLHSVTASSRLVAQLSTTAGALFQGRAYFNILVSITVPVVYCLPMMTAMTRDGRLNPHIDADFYTTVRVVSLRSVAY